MNRYVRMRRKASSDNRYIFSELEMEIYKIWERSRKLEEISKSLYDFSITVNDYDRWSEDWLKRFAEEAKELAITLGDVGDRVKQLQYGMK